MAKSLMQRAVSKLTGNKDTDEDTELKIKLDKYWQSSDTSRRELDWRWFKYDLWVNGHHYAKWDKNLQQISAPRHDGRPKITINKTYVTLRGVRSHVLQNRPKAEVTPYNLTPENIDQATKLNQFLDYLHDRLHFRQKLRASIWHALKYSVGWWQVLYDDEANEGEGEINVNVIDPYDLYWDPAARYSAEARYCILAVRRNIEDLKEDPKYAEFDWDSIQADKQLAASSLKSRMLQFERGSSTVGNNQKDDGTVIVKEYWYKESKEETVEEDDMEAPAGEDGKQPTKQTKQKKTHIMLCTKVGDKIIRKPFDTKLNRFPFFRLCSDIEPLSMYGQGWVKNLIPANKLLNLLESSVAEYNILVNKGKYISDKGAGVRIINNEHGQVIEKKRGFDVTAMAIPQMSAIIESQITNANRYIEDLGALHEASAGRIPTGAKSGVAIEALQEADSNNLSELTENTEEFLEDVYEYILSLASQKYQFARNITTTTTSGERVFLNMIGEEANDDVKQEGTTVIPKKNTVDVSIKSWLAYTSEGRRDAIKDLASIMPNLDEETILSAYQIGPIADIIKRIREKEQQQMDQQAQQAQQQSQMQQEQAANQAAIQTKQQIAQSSIDQSNGPQPAGRNQAIAFIRMMLNGSHPALPQAVTPEFIQYIDHFIASPEGQSAGGALLSVLQQDRDQLALHVMGQPPPQAN